MNIIDIEKTKKVICALEKDDYDWRTVDGIAKETELDPNDIHDIINHQEETIIRSAIRDEKGRDLYTTRDHYKKKRGIISRGINIFAGKMQ